MGVGVQTDVRAGDTGHGLTDLESREAPLGPCSFWSFQLYFRASMPEVHLRFGMYIKFQFAPVRMQWLC